MTEQLKPCPFCGGEGKIFGAIHGHDEADVFVAGCKKKDCIDGPLHNTPEAAAKWWNTRYEPQPEDKPYVNPVEAFAALRERFGYHFTGVNPDEPEPAPQYTLTTPTSHTAIDNASTGRLNI